ncbi:MAG: ferredoxin [Candidatus Dojkabacteria bacterium]|jgi:ferredoxin|nr:ferredoxin [Candidatus Dojkabacteria bacterium]
MKVSIDQSLCIACGSCVAICPEVFEMKEDGTVDVKSEWKGKEIPVELQAKVQEAHDVCPVTAIVIEE